MILLYTFWFEGFVHRSSLYQAVARPFQTLPSQFYPSCGELGREGPVGASAAFLGTLHSVCLSRRNLPNITKLGGLPRAQEH